MAKITIKGDRNEIRFGLFAKRGRTRRKLFIRRYEFDEIKREIVEWFVDNRFFMSMENGKLIAFRQIKISLIPWSCLYGKIFIEVSMNEEKSIIQIELYNHNIAGYECSIECIAYIDEGYQYSFFGEPPASTAMPYRDYISLAEDFLTFLDSKGKWVNE